MLKIISISGLDGSGKSTQINLLKQHLEKQGKKVFYFHAIAFSFPQKLKEFKSKYCLICRFTNACRTTKKDSQEKSSLPRTEVTSGAGVTKASWFQIQLRKVALIIDIARFKSFKKKLEKQGYDYLVSDRYFYDSLINIAYLQNSSLPPNSYHLIPVPDFAFYLDANPENIMSRDRVPDQGLEYLKKKKELLDAFSKENNLIQLDGNKNKDEIFEEIKTIIA